MFWQYVKQLKSEDWIDDFEFMVKYEFCSSFRRCVMDNNGGRPDNTVFDTDTVKERVLKTFLSFNKDDIETVWKVYEWNKRELANRYVPFALDGCGNFICFDANNNRVILLNHENMAVEIVADDFDSFMEELY